MMKVNTVEQYKIIEYLKKNFEDISLLKIEFIDRNSILVKDDTSEIVFKFIDGEVTYENKRR